MRARVRCVRSWYRVGTRGRGSVGRASPCQGEGRGFESRRPLQYVNPGLMPGVLFCRSVSCRGLRRVTGGGLSVAWLGAPTSVRPMTRWPFAGGVSQVATSHHADDEQYLMSSRAIGEANLHHRKHWEWAYIHATAVHADVIGDGRSALGFGVGSEPLVAAFAAAGSTVLATDQSPETAAAWADTGQHAASLAAVQRPQVCAPDVLAERVTFRTVDMTSLPSDLGVFDLVWSSCCFEHLGSPEAGFDFVMAAMQHVRPGGVAVHTTEFDTTRWRRCRETGSVAAGDYVAFYRGRDLRRLVRRLRAAGHEVTANWRVSNDHPMERRIGTFPYDDGPQMRLDMAGRRITSFGLCITRGD